MIEKGVPPPPRFNLRDMTAIPPLLRYIEQVDIWFRALRDNFARTRTYSVTVDATNVGANTTSEQTFTVTGLGTTDIVYVNKPSHSAGLGIVNARVSAANTLAITYMNTTGAGIDPGSETYTVVAIRR